MLLGKLFVGVLQILFLVNHSESRLQLFPIFRRFACLRRFLLFDFDTQDHDAFSARYFRDDSTMTLAEAGEYKGADNILEYVKFAQDDSPYVLTAARTDSESKFLEFDENGICHFNLILENLFELDPTYVVGPNKILFALMFHLEFDYRQRYIPHVSVYYTKGTMKFLFDNALNSTGTRDFVCGVYNNDCSTTIPSVPDCTDLLAALPTLDANAHFDGNSQGCRTLHAVFARENQNHCHHISFDPSEDSNGDIKCQTPGDIEPTDLFSAQELDDFEAFMVKRRIDLEAGYNVVEDEE